MNNDYSQSLNPTKALIWRIVHIQNIPWIIANGLHSGNSTTQSPHWISIGSRELIQKRNARTVPIAPHGTLNDYVPFYFTPFSPMLLNIKTGRGDVKQRQNEDIVILVSSLHKIKEYNLPFVFTDSHAYYNWANFYNDLSDLKAVDWLLLQNKDFKRDENDPAKFERYQAEALIYNKCPFNAIIGVMCYNENAESILKAFLNNANIEIPVYIRPKVYF